MTSAQVKKENTVIFLSPSDRETTTDFASHGNGDHLADDFVRRLFNHGELFFFFSKRLSFVRSLIYLLLWVWLPVVFVLFLGSWLGCCISPLSAQLGCVCFLPASPQLCSTYLFANLPPHFPQSLVSHWADTGYTAYIHLTPPPGAGSRRYVQDGTD